jgi:NTP pyrophosphatase (non-canonical NTP hydrolase)
MNLNEISERLGKVSDIYAEKFGIRRDDDWFVLKIQEELGELSSAYLKLTQRARIGEETQAFLETNLKEEIADVIAMTLLFAKHKGIDVEQAIKDKWFRYL